MSSLMRSVIYDFSEKTIPLSKEIELVKKYISLQKLKYDEEDDITVTFEFDQNSIELNPPIAPLIILPFVENAFKHGIDIYNTSFIHILIESNHEMLALTVKNSNHSSVKAGSYGIGLDNMKKRLQWLYPNHHQLHVDSGNPFIIKLELNYRHIPTAIS